MRKWRLSVLFLVFALSLGLAIFWGCGDSGGGGGESDDDTGDDDSDDELPPGCTDEDGDGYSPDGGECGPIDCDDNDPNTYPGAEELCDGKDNNCDGERESECWQVVGVDNAGKVGRYPSIWFDPATDYPAVAYIETTGKGSSMLKFAYYDGSEWHTEYVDPEAYDARYPTLRIGADGTYHIAYRRGSNLIGYIVYAYGSPGNWTNEIVKKGLLVSKDYPSLTLDAQGNPLVFYYDGEVFGDHGLICARKSGGSWSTTTVDENANEASYDRGGRTYAATRADGTVGVVYQNEDYEVYGEDYLYYYQLWYAESQDYTNWTVALVHEWGEDYPDIVTGGWSVLAYLPSNSEPVISFFYGPEGSYEPGFAIRSEGLWDVYGWDLDFDVGEWPALATVGNHGLFAYFNKSEVALYLCDFDMDLLSGECEAIDGGTDSVGKWPSIAVNSLGDPAIAYYDLTNTQLKVAWYRRFGE
ncbi:MAG TPA: hypothetical protein ENF73_02585 [Proteobacteria bacterium]|nr:hypothetical protein [Pseudomonadota bacterium]